MRWTVEAKGWALRKNLLRLQAKGKAERPMARHARPRQGKTNRRAVSQAYVGGRP